MKITGHLLLESAHQIGVEEKLAFAAGFDIDQRDTSRLTLVAVEITETGFVAEIATWRETRVYSVAFSWLALGA